MKVLDNLFILESSETLGCTQKYTLRTNGEHFVYGVHFPGNPITPGACMIQLMSELVQRQLGKNLILKELVNVKFMNILSPSSSVIYMDMTVVEDDGCDYKVKANLVCSDVKIAQITMILADEQ